MWSEKRSNPSEMKSERFSQEIFWRRKKLQCFLVVMLVFSLLVQWRQWTSTKLKLYWWDEVIGGRWFCYIYWPEWFVSRARQWRQHRERSQHSGVSSEPEAPHPVLPFFLLNEFVWLFPAWCHTWLPRESLRLVLMLELVRGWVGLREYSPYSRYSLAAMSAIMSSWDTK